MCVKPSGCQVVVINNQLGEPRSADNVLLVKFLVLILSMGATRSSRMARNQASTVREGAPASSRVFACPEQQRGARANYCT